jgi:TRAP-type C4-dicarboxylate transport system permease small subunit
MSDDHADLPAPGIKLGEGPPRVSESIERFLAATVMAALCLITFANVVVRYLTDRSFAFTEEYSVVLMVVLTLLGAAAAFAGDRHIRLTFLVERLPRSVQRRVELGVLLASFVMFALLAVLGTRLAWDEYRYEVTSSGLGNPQWIYTGVLPVLSLVACLRIVGRLVRVLRVRGPKA